jgi:hypothetical protein
VLGQRPFVVLAICGLVFSFLYAIFVMALSIPTIEEREKIRGAFASVLQSAARKRSFAPGLTRS